MNITDALMQYSEKENAQFQIKLTPGVNPDSFLGVRVPNLRKVEKEYRGSEELTEFIKHLPHKHYDENMLHSVVIANMKNYDQVIEELERFLPYIDNWAVCDTLRPGIFKKHQPDLLEHIKKWISSDRIYTCRFGIDMLMTYYLDGEFKAEYLELPAAVISEEYYVNMMIAWYFATALAKQWEATIPYIEQHKLGDWVHKKTIQKACESYRITTEQKAYLKTLKYK